jgi:hypothetical protein
MVKHVPVMFGIAGGVLSAVGLVVTLVRAYEADRSYVRSLEQRIELLERIGYQEHPDYAAAIYYATGRRFASADAN